MLKRVVGLIGAALAFVSCIAGVASAQPADRRTYFTFSGPVSIPGVTLPAGTYLFRVVGTSANVVAVLSGDGKKPYAQFFVQHVDIAEAPAQSEVRFMETARGMPQAIKAWWYVGERSGYEFVYPKQQARLLAKGAGAPVLTDEPTAPAAAEGVATPALELIVFSGAVTPAPETEPVEPVAGNDLAGQPAPATIVIVEQPVVRQARTQLPRTASSTPLVGLAGLLLLLGAALVREWRMRLG